jgi:hypothetical protein
MGLLGLFRLLSFYRFSQQRLGRTLAVACNRFLKLRHGAMRLMLACQGVEGCWDVSFPLLGVDTATISLHTLPCTCKRLIPPSEA